GDKFSTDAATTFFHKFDFVNLNGAVRSLLGQREMNNIVKLDNGNLILPNTYVEDAVIAENTDKITSFKNYLAYQGIPVIYVMTPNSLGLDESVLPKGVDDYGNEYEDRFKKALTENGVFVLDIREEFKKDGLDHYDMMYKTDHHWTTKTGFYVYRKISDIVEKILECEVDPVVKDLNNYTITTYEDWHLGSYGQRTGQIFGGIDDFDLIVPNFETSVTSGENTGEFKHMIIYPDALAKKDVTSRYTYDNVLSGSTLNNFVNNNSHNDKKILLFSDSMGKSVAPYFEISYAEVRNSEYPYTYEQIEEYKPDVVIIMYSPPNSQKSYYFDYVLP
nr:hypothetical protein [Lachnospiraceae bacterium]